MIKQHFLISLFLLISYYLSIGQSNDTTRNSVSNSLKEELIFKNNFYFELAGNGLFESINYERVLFNKNKLYFTGRIGGGYMYWHGGNSIFIPIMLNNRKPPANCIY